MKQIEFKTVQDIKDMIEYCERAHPSPHFTMGCGWEGCQYYSFCHSKFDILCRPDFYIEVRDKTPEKYEEWCLELLKEVLIDKVNL